MRLLALLAVISGGGLIGASAGGIVSSGDELRAAAEAHTCTPAHVRRVNEL